MIERILNAVKRRINRYLFLLLKLFPRKKYDLVILDDAFPTVSNLFRIIEFNKYLETYNTTIYTSSSSIGKLGNREQFKKDLNEYIL